MVVGARTWIESWPVYRQLTGTDPRGLGAATKTARSAALRPRTATADKTVKSICPYCAVGCAQNVFVSGEKVVQIEGDPDSPVSVCHADDWLVTAQSRLPRERM